MRSKKIVFFFPAFSSQEATAPLGILAVSTPLLRAGYQIRIIDSTITPNFQKQVLEELRDDEHGVDLRIRQPRRRVAAAAPVQDVNLPVTVFAVASALGEYPAIVAPLLADGHEICSHGYRWINYQRVDEATERAHVAKAVEIIKRLTGEAPLGWYTGRDSPNTRRLVVEHGGFLYDADDYNDDLPFWVTEAASRIWSCPTRSTPTTCASPPRRASTPASSSSPI